MCIRDMARAVHRPEERDAAAAQRRNQAVAPRPGKVLQKASALIACDPGGHRQASAGGSTSLAIAARSAASRAARPNSRAGSSRRSSISAQAWRTVVRSRPKQMPTRVRLSPVSYTHLVRRARPDRPERGRACLRRRAGATERNVRDAAFPPGSTAPMHAPVPPPVSSVP